MEITLALSRLEILHQVDQLKLEIDGLRPLSKNQEGRIFQKFRLDWNYHSNAIEGNSLTYGETRALLLYGLTAKGKPFKDHLDIKGHNEAIDFLLALVKDDRPLSELDIREMHKLVLKEPYRTKAQTEDGRTASKVIHLGVYKTSPNHVQTPTGELHYYATPEETPAKMKDLMDWYNEASQNPQVHPAVLAALFHYRFVAIHPFDDGNGRMARLLMNLILMRHEYPPVVIRQDKDSRNQYYLALSQADAREYEPFAVLVIEALLHAMNIYLKGARGEDINEPDDLDKELALFRKELGGERLQVRIRKNRDVIKKVYETYVKSILEKTKTIIDKFEGLFLSQRIVDIESNDFNEIYRYSLKKLSDSGESPDMDLTFILKDFKYGNLQFNYSIRFRVYFSEYKYEISIGTDYIREEDNRVQKYYHQPITEHEIEQLVTHIGQDLLMHIKSNYKNGDATNELPH